MFRNSSISSLVILLAIVFATRARAENNCIVTLAEREASLALPFKQFDQEQGRGWRPLYSKKCYSEASLLLTEYMERNPSEAKIQYMLSFHTGQMLALAGERSKPIKWLERGRSKQASARINWNAFVDANIAFLEHDRKKLLIQRDLIGQEPAIVDGPGVPSWAVGKKMNLDVVEGFIACFEESYEVAYGDECRHRGAGNGSESHYGLPHI